MKSVKFIVYGKPYGKKNMKPTMRGGHATSYQPSENLSYMQEVKQAYISANGMERLFDDHEPISVRITAYYPIPSSVSKKRAKLMLDGWVLPTVKPDCDNISKVILDSLTGIAYRDDAQVALEFIGKRYSDVARVEVELKSLREDQ